MFIFVQSYFLPLTESWASLSRKTFGEFHARGKLSLSGSSKHENSLFSDVNPDVWLKSHERHRLIERFTREIGLLWENLRIISFRVSQLYKNYCRECHKLMSCLFNFRRHTELIWTRVRLGKTSSSSCHNQQSERVKSGSLCRMA